jgi:hypothetical protein
MLVPGSTGAFVGTYEPDYDSGGDSKVVPRARTASSEFIKRPALHLGGFFAALALMLIAGAVPAFACETLQIRSELQGEQVFATGAHIEALALIDNTERSPETKWRAEYATSESGPWTPAGGGTEFKGNFAVFLGPEDERGRTHHLIPATTYYARFHVENECGAAERTFEFKTTAIAKPGLVTNSYGIWSDVSPTAAAAQVQIESNGAETKYSFEYAPAESGHAPAENSPSWAPFTSDASGTITVAEDFATPKASITGLTPETTYYARIKATNSQGTIIYSPDPFATPTNKPFVFTNSIRNVTATTAHVTYVVQPHGFETKWRFEVAASVLGPWSLVPGAAGKISQKEAEALFKEEGVPGGDPFASVGARLTGLSPATPYYVRVFAESAAGEGETCAAICEPISISTNGITSFETAGPPSALGAATFATHALHGESIRLLGDVNPRSIATSEEQTVAVEGTPTGGTFTLTFEGQTTAPIAFDATAESVQQALNPLSTIRGAGGEVTVSGGEGGPYSIYFFGGFTEKNQPQITADASGLISSGSGVVSVTTTQQGGEAYDAHYHFEYVSQHQFEAEGGFAKASSTSEVDAGTGDNPVFAGQDIPGLTAGETYHYRISATNDSLGNPVVHGAEETVTAPVAASVGDEGACPNQALRTGPSANLPDCRAYEQLTPVDKEGSQEIFRYEGLKVPAYALVGEDGDHLMIEAPVSWGSDAKAGQSPYFFTRTPTGWQTTSAAPQPETGVDTYTPQVFSSNLTQLGFEARFTTGGSQSRETEFRAGPPGGPYVTVATVPNSEVGTPGGWVAASADSSKRILEVEDRRLVEPQTTTKSGADLYEYSEGGLRQVNVGIGTCGASIVKGNEEIGYGEVTVKDKVGNSPSGSNAVSTDGSRVFFEAVPGSNCSEPKHLYVRVNGVETIDLGAYSLAAANSRGSEVLLEKSSGENPGLYLEKVGSPAKFLSSTGLIVGAAYSVSDDLKAVYLESTEQLTPEAPAPSPETGSNVFDTYRYDVSTEKLSFVVQAEHEANQSTTQSRDGRYYYFVSGHVAGLPVALGYVESQHKVGETRTLQVETRTLQVYRYDSAEGVVECVSCASSFDPEPKLVSYFGNIGLSAAPTGTPKLTLVSSNGDFAFFQTPAALVPSDVDGEVIPEGLAGLGLEHPSDRVSVSTDVYEWRRDGLYGCAHLQGCLALITNGRGGVLNAVLGSAEEGRDVFIYTHSQLVPQDNDSAGDIYDVRIGGGFPPPPPGPVECEGDACSTPASAPIDSTPSSLTFTGAGNVVQPSVGKTVVKSKKPKAKKKPTKKKPRKGRRKGKAGKRAVKSRGTGGKSSRRSK